MDEFWGQDFFRDNGCVGEGEPMPIANTDIKARIAYDISGEGSVFGQYNLQLVDEYQNKKEFNRPPEVRWSGVDSAARSFLDRVVLVDVS